MDAPATDQCMLASLQGREPEAPAWFDWAMEQAPDVRFVENEGARIQYLVWGEEGKPGLFLLHGGGAHAWWWAHIAPFFAEEYRVVAMSMTGMGGSDWRDEYAIDQHARDMRCVAEAAGHFADGKPILVGHSFGGAPTAVAAADEDAWVRYAVILDSPLHFTERPQNMPENSKPRVQRFFDRIEEGLARFRLMPPQGCDNLYIADMIARHSLTRQPDGRWSWSFDPQHFANTKRLDSREMAKAATCPLAVVYGDKSWIMNEERVAGLREDLPEATPFVAIPDCEHHVMIDQPLALVAVLRTLFEGA